MTIPRGSTEDTQAQFQKGLSHPRHAPAHLRQAAGPAAVDKRAEGRGLPPRALSSSGSVLGLPRRTSTPHGHSAGGVQADPHRAPGPPALAIGTLLCVCVFLGQDDPFPAFIMFSK